MKKSKYGVIIPNYSKERYQREAFRTWSNFYEPTTNANMVKNYVNGTLSCFCDDEYKEHGLSIFSKEYREDGLDQAPAELEKNAA